MLVTDRVVAAFRKHDVKGDGLIPVSVLGAVLKALDPTWDDAVVSTLLRSYGRPRADDRILYAEFFAWLLGAGPELVSRSSASRLDSVYRVEGQTLGAGGFGTVRKATHISTGNARAIKTIKKRADQQDTQKAILEAEIAIMKGMDHPGIIKLYDVFEDAKFLHLVMEICDGGELLQRILREDRFSEHDASGVMRQVMFAIRYIHGKSVCHRDLKLENFLLAERELPLEDSTVKIVDFGLAESFKAGIKMTAQVGTPLYVAPEVLLGEYTHACDLWSCGVIAYILLCGYPPFPGTTKEEQLKNVLEGTYTFPDADWSSVSDNAKDFIRRLLEKNTDQRLSAEQGADHAWIQNRSSQRSDCPLQAKLLQNIREFGDHNRLKKAALLVVARRMKREDIDHLKDVFLSLDKNGDGEVSFQELRDGMNGLSLQPDAMHNLDDAMTGMDINWDKRINYTEFLASAMDRKKYQEELVCWEAFQVFDRDGSGSISRQELLQVLHKSDVEDIMGSIAISRVMEQCDADQDGTIDFEEFMHMMRA